MCSFSFSPLYNIYLLNGLAHKRTRFLFRVLIMRKEKGILPSLQRIPLYLHSRYLSSLNPPVRNDCEESFVELKAMSGSDFLQQWPPLSQQCCWKQALPDQDHQGIGSFKYFTKNHGKSCDTLKVKIVFYIYSSQNHGTRRIERREDRITCGCGWKWISSKMWHNPSWME